MTGHVILSPSQRAKGLIRRETLGSAQLDTVNFVMPPK
jgi:hypothetical protein